MHAFGGSPLLHRLARDGYVALSIAFLLLRLFQVPPWDQSVDAYAYWGTRDGELYDGQGAGVIGSYLYSPAFAQLLTPLVLLPWPAFVTVWTAFNLATLWWLVGRWSLPAMLFLPVPFEIVSGNVHLLIAAAIVLAVRCAAGTRAPALLGPAAWALPILTKVTPGIGLAWHAVRREWRALGVAAGATIGIVVVSYLLDPDAWSTWFDTLNASSSTPSTVGWFLPVALVVRLPVALLAAIVAGFTGRAWLLPIAAMLALPVVWFNSLAMLVACVPLWRWEMARQREVDGARAGASLLSMVEP